IPRGAKEAASQGITTAAGVAARALLEEIGRTPVQPDSPDRRVVREIDIGERNISVGVVKTATQPRTADAAGAHRAAGSGDSSGRSEATECLVAGESDVH